MSHEDTVALVSTICLALFLGILYLGAGIK
jgi:hypothetical protein